MTHDELLAYYAAPGVFTAVDGFAAQVEAIRDDIPSIVAAVQGLLIHHALMPTYGAALSPEQETHRELHSATAMLACATRGDERPLAEPRPPERRVAGVCRHFATLLAAILRHKGIPARARCGFANYFDRSKNVDHWVGEYWHAAQARWVLADAQVDERQRALFKIDIDTLDVPRDRFLVAGDAWRLCRAGGADPMDFGVGGTELWGLVEVFGDVFQDLAALQKIELLPWGWYGLATDQAENSALHRETELIDALAALSSAADAAAIDKLSAMIAADGRIAVPPGRLEEIVSAERISPAA